MDEIDHIQEADIARQEALLTERRKLADAEARTIPPAHRKCDICGEDIPIARLRAKPTTRLCVDCQTDLERVSGHH
jgi:phage/conjugal plasmid C-4 type zinc finger TraR family protein